MNVRDVGVRAALDSRLFHALRDGDFLDDDHVGGCVLYEKREQVAALLTAERLEAEAGFVLTEEADGLFSYNVSLSEPFSEQVTAPLWRIMQRAVDERRTLWLEHHGTHAYTASDLTAIESVRAALSAHAEAGDGGAFFCNAPDDGGQLALIAAALCESDMTLVLDSADFRYDGQYLALWDVPSYCARAGIDMGAEGWEAQLAAATDMLYDTEDLFSFVYGEDGDDRHGVLMNYGAESCAVVPYAAMKAAWDAYAAGDDDESDVGDSGDDGLALEQER